MQLISDEAKRLDAAMQASPVAFSYFDPSDRLQLWNAAYEALNFRIGHLIRRGASFPDLLAELVVRGQIAIDGDCLRVRDLGSLNGTFVNGEKVSTQQLSDEDEVRVAWNTFKFLDNSRPNFERTAIIPEL